MVASDRSIDPAEPTITSALSGRRWSAESLVAEVLGCDRDVAPFEATTLELVGAMSERLLQLREHPEAVALGFWMRPAAVEAMRTRFEASVPEGQLAVPRGLAFHVTPANVDTMFMYSWVLSLLVGNTNIVRLSSRASQTRTGIVASISEILADGAFEPHAARNQLILTDHAESTSAILSAAADVRVVWGGNATVERFRGFPIPAHARDITFPDRHSMAILDARTVAEADESELASLADRFFDDAYWFDQGACSSPRLLLWRAAGTREQTETAVRSFRDAVIGATQRRHYVAETGMALNKMAFATEVAARVDGVQVESEANEAYWVRLSGVADYDRENCGGGLFFEIISADLEADLLALVGPRDQTVSTYGLEKETLLALARRLNGRGVDRFVPVGRALAFGSDWDGLDLLHEFSKRVVVDAGRGS